MVEVIDPAAAAAASEVAEVAEEEDANGLFDCLKKNIHPVIVNPDTNFVVRVFCLQMQR